MPIMLSISSLRAKLLLAALAVTASACTYTRSVSQTNVPRQREHPVEASTERYIFIAAFDTDEVSQLTTKLQQKCPGGRVLGITTKDIHTLYLWIFFWSREVVADGFCVKAATADLTPGPDESGSDLAFGGEEL